MKTRFVFIGLVVIILCGALPTYSTQDLNLLYSFESFPAGPVYDGAVWKPNPKRRQFKTVISECMKKGVNFAGHFIVCDWGCGTSCQQIVVIDAKSGKVYDGISTSLGYLARPDSRLLVANLPDENGRFVCPGCSTEYYVWNDTAFKALPKTKVNE